MSRQDGQWQTTGNYAGGDAVGASWTDKIFAAKATASEHPETKPDDAIEDDEWVRQLMHFISYSFF